jgi:hypothetical protein
MQVADPAVGDPTTATPRVIFFSFFLNRNEKKGTYCLKQILKTIF